MLFRHRLLKRFPYFLRRLSGEQLLVQRVEQEVLQLKPEIRILISFIESGVTDLLNSLLGRFEAFDRRSFHEFETIEDFLL